MLNRFRKTRLKLVTMMVSWLASILLLAHFQAITSQAWKEMYEYEYGIHMQTLTGIADAKQYTGNILKGTLIIQRQPLPQENIIILTAKISGLKYSEIHQNISKPNNFIDEEIPEQWHNIETTKKPFKITIHHGKITGIIVNKIVPNWEANLYKAILSQFQINTNGTNIKSSTINQLPNCSTFGTFRVMEDTITGNVDTLYEIHPIPDIIVQNQPWFTSISNVTYSENFIEILKTKNYSNYKELPSYHYGWSSMGRNDPSTNQMGDFFLRSSTSQIVISGNLKEYLVHSTITTNKVIVHPSFTSKETMVMSSIVNATLLKLPEEVEAIMQVVNPVHIGNLVYKYDFPFANDNLVRAFKNPIDHEFLETSQANKVIYEGNAQLLDSESEESEGSASSSSYSNPLSSEEQHSYYSNIGLTLPPNVAFLPFYTGYKGRSIKGNDKFIIQNEAEQLITLIAQEYLTKNQKENSGLNNYLTLTSLLRIMNSNEMQLLTNKLYTNKTSGDEFLKYKICIDALSETGTGPALLVMKKLIENNKINVDILSETIGTLMSSSRQPTYQYIFQLYGLLNAECIVNNTNVHAMAHISFANLIRKVYFSKRSSHTEFATHMYGSFRTKQGIVFAEENYVHDMTKHLENSIENGDDLKAVVYIISLGNLAHKKTVRAFEPYLEGTKPCSKFKRLLMVAAFDKLCAVKPKTARSVLFKIFQNPGEDVSVRIVAVFNIMKADPPANLLQQLAERANDPSTQMQLKSAIYSAIKSAARIEDPEYVILRSHAKAAEALLDNENFGNQYSKINFFEYINHELNAILQANIAVLRSKYPFLSGANFAIGSSFSEAKFNLLNLNYLMTNYQGIHNPKQAYDPKYFLQDALKTSWSNESILKMFNINIEKAPTMEGIISYKIGKLEGILPISNYTLQQFNSVFQSMKTMTFDYAKTVNLHENAMAFPMESSLPCLFTVDLPVFYNFKGEMSNNDKFAKNFSARTKILGRYQSQLNIIFPYNQTIYTSGITKNIEINLPLVNLTTNLNEIKIRIAKLQDSLKLFKYSSIPYTSKQTIFSGNNDDIRNKKIAKKPDVKVTQNFGPINLKWISDKTDFNYKNFDLSFLTGLNFVNVTLSIYPEFKSTQITLNTFEKYANKNYCFAKPILKQLSQLSQNTTERMLKMFEYGNCDVKNGKTFVGDMTILINNQNNIDNHYRITFSHTKSFVGTKSNFLIHFTDSKFHFGLIADGNFPILSKLDKETRKIQANLTINLSFGKKFLVENNAKVIIDWYKSDENNKYLQNLINDYNCLNVTLGNGEYCLDIFKKLHVLDGTKISLKYENFEKDYLDFLNSLLVKYFKNIFEGTKQKKELANTKQIYIDAQFNNELDNLKLKIAMDRKTNINENFAIGYWPKQLLGINTDLSIKEAILNTIYNKNELHGTCFVNTNTLKTFDGKWFENKLERKHYYPLLVYVPTNIHNESEKISIFVKENEYGNNDFLISIRNYETKYENLEWEIKSRNYKTVAHIFENYMQHHILLNVSQGSSVNFGQTLAAFVINDGTLKIRLDDNLEIFYKKKEIKLKLLNEKFYGNTRGLCGTYNNEKYDDFTTLNNCIARTSGIFIDSYDMSKQNVSKQGHFDCIYEKQLMLDVISNRDAKHTKEEKKNEACNVDENLSQENTVCMREKYLRDDKIPNTVCYSTKKIPFCIAGCQPVKFVHKMIPFWCTIDTEDTKIKIETIIKNVPNKRVNMTIPFACYKDENVNQKGQN